MDWEAKTQMCRHFNCSEDEKAVDLVIENIETMDEQAWDMFFTGITLTKDSMSKCADKHKKIFQYSQHIKFGSWKTATRAALYDVIINEL